MGVLLFGCDVRLPPKDSIWSRPIRSPSLPRRRSRTRVCSSRSPFPRRSTGRTGTTGSISRSCSTTRARSWKRMPRPAGLWAIRRPSSRERSSTLCSRRSPPPRGASSSPRSSGEPGSATSRCGSAPRTEAILEVSANASADFDARAPPAFAARHERGAQGSSTSCARARSSRSWALSRAESRTTSTTFSEGSSATRRSCARILKDRPTAAKYVETIERAAVRGAELTGRLLSASRKSKGQLLPVNLNQIVEETLELLAHTLPKGIRIDKRLDPGSTS